MGEPPVSLYSYDGNFTTNVYKVAGSPVSQATAVSVARNSPAWVENLAGAWSYVAPNTPARSDAGLMLNAAADALITTMGWTPSVNITWNSGTGAWETDLTPDDVFGASVVSYFGTSVFYCDVTSGTDGGAATSWGTARRKIQDCIALGNATGGPYIVYIKAGTYGRDRGFSLGGTGTLPTQRCAFIAVDGRVVNHTADPITWGAADGTYPNTYKIAKSNVARVVRPDIVDADGDLLQLTYVADQATCNTTPNSWSQVDANANLCVNLNGDVASDSTVRAMRKSPGLAVNSGVDVYIEGIDFQGGAEGAVAGCLFLGASTTRKFWAEDCTFRYAGGTINGTQAAHDNVTILNSDGFHVFNACQSSRAAKDAFNNHNSDGSASSFVLTIDCTGRYNGDLPSTSNNALTGHEYTQHIDLNGDYRYARGGLVAFIANSAFMGLGTTVKFDRDDAGIGPIGYRVIDTANMWLLDCSAEMTSSGDYSTRNSASSHLYIRNFDNITGTMDGDEEAIGAVNPTQALLADTLTINATGTNDWTLVYDDDSTEAFTAVSGNLVKAAADLSRPLVKSYTAVAA